MHKVTSTITGLRYLEKLRAFKALTEPEKDYYESFDSGTGWDLYFFCSDGVVSAHRLVISNVSKYIMSMFDDQPPWYPTHIHVLDLPKSIVQILVDLAYTGEMRFPEELQSDVIDAMQTLGWIHTDNLSAYYDGEEVDHSELLKKSPMKYEQMHGASDDAGAEAVLQMSFPVTRQKSVAKPSKASTTTGRVERLSFIEEDEESMEISNLPEVDWSDNDNEESAMLDSEITPTKKKTSTAVEVKRKLSAQNDLNEDVAIKNPSNTKIGKNSLEIDKTIDENVKPSYYFEQEETKTPSRRSSRRSSRRASFSDSNIDTDPDKVNLDVSSVDKPDIVQKLTVKKGRKRKISESSVPESIVDTTILNPVTTTTTTLTVDDNISSTSETSQDSPGKRQRRKPKRFEEYEDTSEKPKSKSPSKRLNEPKKGGKKNIVVLIQHTSSENQNQMSDESTLDPEAVASQESTKVIDKKTMPKKTPRKKNSSAKVSNKGEETEVQLLPTTPPLSNENPIEQAKASKTPAKSISKKKRSVETSKNALITSYFTHS